MLFSVRNIFRFFFPSVESDPALFLSLFSQPSAISLLLSTISSLPSAHGLTMPANATSPVPTVWRSTIWPRRFVHSLTKSGLRSLRRIVSGSLSFPLPSALFHLPSAINHQPSSFHRPISRPQKHPFSRQNAPFSHLFLAFLLLFAPFFNFFQHFPCIIHLFSLPLHPISL